jgi:ABC-2 type transport system ATP-binding protein
MLFMTSPPDAAVTVALDGFTIRYGSFTAVDRASFSMPLGACGLLGRNGAGKSSIIKTVLGLLEQSEGSAQVLGFDTQRESLRVRERVGYMPERESLLPGLTGLETVVLAGQLSGLPKRRAWQRAHEVLFLVGIAEERYRRTGTYSTGMKQRVKLATALVHDPALLFLDEPTNGLDPGGREEILALLRRLVNEHGKSLILSSHILPDVESICSYVVVMDSGRILTEGNIEELTANVTSRYRLELDGDTAQYITRLQARGIVATPREGGGIEAELPPQMPPAEFFQAARDSAALLRRCEPERRSLSDVFLSTVQEVPR